MFATGGHTSIWSKLLARNFSVCDMAGNLFDQLKIFNDLSLVQRDLLKPLFIPCDFLAGEVIFEQGNPADCLYIVLEGEVLIRFKPEDGPALTVTRIQSGGVVGWSAALGSPTYTSSAVCSTDCQLVHIHGEDLRELCRQDPEMGSLVLERLAAVIAERLRNTHEYVIALLEQGLRINIRNPQAH